MNREQLLEQIEALKSMGLGGFHLYPRTGLDTPYLGEEFLGLARDCVQKAKSEGMRAYFYDENGAGQVEVIASAHSGRTGNGTLIARYKIAW